MIDGGAINTLQQVYQYFDIFAQNIKNNLIKTYDIFVAGSFNNILISGMQVHSVETHS